MKLRNKETGEIGNLKSFNNDKRVCVWINKETDLDYIYNSLAELDKDWEDYEESKGCWIIDIFGVVEYTHFRNKAKAELLKQIGNYFETREEAEKAVEKLKAWKRLKDKGFRFKGKKTDSTTYKHYVEFEVCSKDVILFNDDIEADLDLLFGGEE